jgi:DNA helicase MCM8
VSHALITFSSLLFVSPAAPSWKLPFEVHCQLLPLMSNQHLDLHSRDGHSYQHSARDAKTSVFMIGQPSGGAKYDKRRSVSENLRLPSSHLNEFDLVFVVEEGLKKDEMVDYAQRELMTPMIHDAASPSPMLGAASPRVPMTPASAVSGTASRLKTKLALKSNEFEPLPANVFKQYLQLARSLPPPTISEEVRGQLDARFRSLQSTADSSQMEEGSCADVRPLNTLVRLSQARARLELSPVVTLEHVQDVWDLLTYCQSEHGGTMLHGEEHKDMRGSQ